MNENQRAAREYIAGLKLIGLSPSDIIEIITIALDEALQEYPDQLNSIESIREDPR